MSFVKTMVEISLDILIVFVFVFVKRFRVNNSNRLLDCLLVKKHPSIPWLIILCYVVAELLNRLLFSLIKNLF